MKSLKNILFLFLFSALNFVVNAQEEIQDSYSIALSSPNKPGKLKVTLYSGTIEVRGYNGKEVIINIIENKNQPKDDWHEDHKGSKKGLRRIPSNFIDIEIEESNNTVYVNGSHNTRSRNRKSNMVIQVPINFALQLKSHHNGNIKVSNVIGELEITTHHGGIQMEKVGGSVIADTHHGEISVSFVSVTPNQPMAFSTYHGDVDITFPSSLQCNAKIKTARGDIYTDFDLELKSAIEDNSSSSGRRRIKLGGWMYGKIGSGGEEFLFNTHHGDVVIRKL